MKYLSSTHYITSLLLGGAFVVGAPSCGGRAGENSASGGEASTMSASSDEDGDGVLDSLGKTVDQDKDGKPDQIDVDGDGQNDGVGVDTDGDGKPDGAGLDTDGDEIIDAIDTDGDGKPDDGGNTSGDGDGDKGSGGESGDGDGDTTSNGEGSGGKESGDGDGDGSGGSNDNANPGVKTLGDSCASPGALACAGENQKLQLLCDGSGKWVQNGTCAGTAVCDTGEGNRGSCQEPIEGCLDKEPGDTYCVDGQTHECGLDLVTSTPSEICESYCDADGLACSEDEECPQPSDTTFACETACDADETFCETSDGLCPVLELSKVSLVELSGAYIRLPAGQDLCQASHPNIECDLKTFIVLLPNDSFQVHVPTGWKAFVYPNLSSEAAPYAGALACSEPLVDGCVQIESSQSGGFPTLVLTAESDVPADNLRVTTNASCL